MRLATVSDLHYSCGFDNDIEIAMDDVTKQLMSTHVDYILIPGDVYNNKSSVDSRNVVKERIKTLAGIAPVFIVYGNHDAPGDLDILADLKTAHQVRVFNSATVVNLPQKVNLYVIPWVTKNEWIEKHQNQSIEEVDKQISTQLIEYIKNLKTLNPANKHVVLSHILVAGAKAENNQPLIGEGVTIGQYDLEEAGFDAGILGHIHLRQEFGGGKVFYPGSPSAMDFGESDEKYFNIYDTETDKVEWFRINCVKRISVSGSWTNLKWEQITGPKNINDVSNSRLRITYNIAITEDLELAKNSIKSIYEVYNPLEIKLNPIIETQIRTRAEEVSKANNLEDKLLAYWESTGTKPEEDKETKDILKKLRKAQEICSTLESNLPI